MIRQNASKVLDRDPLVWLSRYRNGLYNRTEFGLAVAFAAIAGWILGAGFAIWRLT